MAEQSFSRLGPAPAFRIDDVLSRSFGLYAKKLPIYYLFALLIGLPNLLLTVTGIGLRPSVENGQVVWPPGYWQTSGLIFGMSLLIYAVEEVALIHIALQDLRGRPFDLGATVSRTLSRTLPVVATLLLCWLAITIASLLLLVPALIVWMMLSVAVPACVDDSPNPFAAISRSAALTKGNRWRLFAFQLAFIVVAVILYLVLKQVLDTLVSPRLIVLLYFPVGVAFSSYGAVLHAVMYHALRETKDGVEGDHIATVFD